jgi:hypothetical protein
MVGNGFQMEWHHWLLVGGGGLVLLAALLYAFLGNRTTMPAIISSSVGCLAVGLAAGILCMASFGYQWEPQTSTGGDGPVQAPAGVIPGKGPGGGGGGAAKPGGGGGGMAAKPGGGGFGGGGGGRGPTAPRQLAGLVLKIDQLTDKPLKLELTPELRKEISVQIEGLREMQQLTDEEARKRHDALLKLLEPQRAVLEAAGFRWPGTGGGGPLGETPNPFREDNHADALERVLGRMKEAAKK